MIKRIIFDLDQTLLVWDDATQSEYFRKRFSKKDADLLCANAARYVDEYEIEYKRYDVSTFAKYLSDRSGINIIEDDIYGWIDICSTMENIIVENVEKSLEYLKDKGYSLVVLTNWFGTTQTKRLEKAGLMKYFDHLYSGEYSTKPCKDSYLMACGEYKLEECFMIGDNYLKDYETPMKLGISSLLYDPKNKYPDVKNRINNMNEIKEIFK